MDVDVGVRVYVRICKSTRGTATPSGCLDGQITLSFPRDAIRERGFYWGKRPFLLGGLMYVFIIIFTVSWRSLL